MSGQRSKTCARCSAEFGCGAESKEQKCWCAELPPVMPVNDEGCLCEKCLRQEIEGLIKAVGLCASCGHAKRLPSKGGATMFLCERSASDHRYEKYPRLPMNGCAGYDMIKS